MQKSNKLYRAVVLDKKQVIQTANANSDQVPAMLKNEWCKTEVEAIEYAEAKKTPEVKTKTK